MDRSRTFIKLISFEDPTYTVQETDYAGANARGPQIAGVRKSGAETPTVPSPAGTTYELETDWQGELFFRARESAAASYQDIPKDEAFTLVNDDTITANSLSGYRDYDTSELRAGYVHFTDPLTLTAGEAFLYSTVELTVMDEWQIDGAAGTWTHTFPIRLLTDDFAQGTITWATRPASSATYNVGLPTFTMTRNLAWAWVPQLNAAGMSAFYVEAAASTTFYGMVIEPPDAVVGVTTGRIWYQQGAVAQVKMRHLTTAAA